MENTKKEYSINQCYHCGNKGLMEVLHVQHEKFGGIIDNEIEAQYYWIMLKCPVCRKVSLIQKYTDESMCDPFEDKVYYYINNIYPLNNYRMDNVPERISSTFEASLKVKEIDMELCLIGFRKVLELICKDNNASGNKLEQKINDMIKKNIFPKDMEVAYWIIRQVGNKAAHDKKLDLTKYDIDEIASLLYSIINYLYIIPKKMIGLKEKICNVEQKKTDN